jgi:hypothetical protein
MATLESSVGFRLFRLEDLPRSFPEAVAVQIPVPDPLLGDRD